ncbi:homocysteine S-methyltransferase family protein [Terrisporobacter sp.]|uniref:homocysteine S-methyltransferase family protein n=1 Tax=Terrisporobacter sp. TaxID=1965305 RepID=UPI00261EBBA4|nr:homocysteine S-methyltransferase family protein [Terrisporobacter sp.]
MEIKEYLKDNILIFDGAMGTMLQNEGLPIGDNPEVFGMKNPDKLLKIHKKYLEAGSNVITTNTFGCNELKVTKLGYTVEEIIDSAVSIAKKAIEETDKTKPRYVALDIGPIGEMLEPMGTLSFDKAYDIFKRQAIQGEKSGADLIIIETMMDLYEAKAAVLAAKENTNLPVICTMTFDENGRSFTGCLPESMVATIEGLGVDALGVNCSLGPKQLLPIVKTITEIANVPVIVQANAGLPVLENNQAVYKMTAYEFFQGVREFVKLGASIIGGCCGTNETFIKEICDNIDLLVKQEPNRKETTIVCSSVKYIDVNGPTIVGERLNPTGRKHLQNAYITGDNDYVINLALEQGREGSQIINVNVGLPEIDEEKAMIRVIKGIQEVVDLPLQIDSSNVKALENGLRYYNGRTIVNSVNGKDESLEKILPIVKKYGACVVGLTLDDNGIPSTAQGRFNIAKKIVERAESYGIKRKDIFIDCLSLTVSAQQEEALETIKAIKMVKENLGCKTILGVSNISFGTPNRRALNNTYLNLALGDGLDLAIINTEDKNMVNSIYAYRVISNMDKGCVDYIKKCSDISEDKKTTKKKNNEKLTLEDVIERGLKEEAKGLTLDILESKDEYYVLDEILIPALDKVGEKYDKGELFLPQMIQSAETVKVSLNIIKERLSQNNSNDGSKGKIIVATVQGDIHDIGKNIVKIMLENYGYQVIDLGKDVPIEDVVKRAKEENIELIGLSALMTTTVENMKKTISALRDNGINAKVFVGGAVLTQEYADKMNANYYSKDAKSAVEIAKINFNSKI